MTGDGKARIEIGVKGKERKGELLVSNVLVH